MEWTAVGQINIYLRGLDLSSFHQLKTLEPLGLNNMEDSLYLKFPP